MAAQIQTIASKNINREKWDDCIRSSNNAVIYAHSFYLDQMADNWSGIVLGDYDAVMPVPWRNKFGIRYAYDVPFIQQLGWFTKNNAINDDMLLPFLFSFVKYGSYSFNYGNKLHTHNLISKNNYIIHLASPYHSIVKNYKEDAINNLKKAARFNLSYQPLDYEEAIKMYKLAYKERFINTVEKDYFNFTALCKLLHEKQMVFAMTAVDENTGIVLATALFIKDELRIYNIMNTTTGLGRGKSANHFLLDNVLKEFAGSGLIFDFEGSDIPGIKLFYEKFGAINQSYQRIEKFNHLSFPFKLFKTMNGQLLSARLSPCQSAG